MKKKEVGWGGGGLRISLIVMVSFNILKFWESSQKFRKSHFVANSEISASVGTGLGTKKLFAKVTTRSSS